jgi:hypothetical protein
MVSVMLSSVAKLCKPLEVGEHVQNEVYLVYRDCVPSIASTIAECLAQQGFNAKISNLLSHDEIPTGASIISFADMENSTLMNSDDVHFRAIQAIISRATTLLWIATSDIKSRPSEPAVMKGMLRAIATENVLLKVAFIQLEDNQLPATTDQTSSSTAQRTAYLITHKFNELYLSAPGDTIDRDCLMKDNSFFVERILPDETLNGQFRLRHGLDDDVQQRQIDDKVPLRANYSQPGVLSSLYFSRDKAFDEPLDDDWLEIKTEAIGLNMKVDRYSHVPYVFESRDG